MMANYPDESDVLIVKAILNISTQSVVIFKLDQVHMSLVHSSARLFVLNPYIQVEMLRTVVDAILCCNCMVTSQLKMS